MGRELKFRAIRISECDGSEKTSVVYSDEYQRLTVGGTLASFFEDNYGSEFEQYTGFRDKKYVEIYEGDLFKVRESCHKVVWHKDGRWLAKTMSPNTYHYYGMSLKVITEEGLYNEVIGNVHKNPELLESK